MTYLNRIKDLREDSDLTQTRIARMINVAQTTYSDYEKGKIRTPIDIVIKLAEFYDVDMNYITGVSNIKQKFPRNKKRRK